MTAHHVPTSRLLAVGFALASVTAVGLALSISGSPVSTEANVLLDRGSAVRLAQADTAGGPKYSGPSHAAEANGVPVPSCRGALSYNAPRDGVVWIHFDKPDVLLGVFREQPISMTGPEEAAPGAEHFTRESLSIDGYPAVGGEWDGQFTVTTEPDGTTRRSGGVYKSSIAWNVGQHGYVIRSEALPFADLVEIVDTCSY